MPDAAEPRPFSATAPPPADGKGIPKYTLDQFHTTGDLGMGSFGMVRRVVHRDTGEVFAMKVLEKEQVAQRNLEEQLKREVLTQLRMRHPNVVRLHYYFEDMARIYCLLECADCGHLFAYLSQQCGGVPELRAAQFFVDTAKGLAYLHSLRVVHRDLKPENILLFGLALHAKIGDFGWCVELTSEVPNRRTFCGTLDYLAPEVLTGAPHDTSVDLWALGVLLYEMLLAKAPFTNASQKETMDRIFAVRFDIPRGSISGGPESLIRGLLVLQGSCRMPLSKVLRHPWLVASAPAQQPGTGRGDDAAFLDVTWVAPRHEAPVATKMDDSVLLEATLQVPRCKDAQGRGQEHGGEGPADASPLLDRTVTVQRHRAGSGVVAATGGGPAAGLQGIPHAVQRQPAEAARGPPSHGRASPQALGSGPSGALCGRGPTPSAATLLSCTSSTASSCWARSSNLDDSDPQMPALAASNESAILDMRLSNTEDDAHISLEDLDGRFVGSGGAGTSLHPSARCVADSWVVRTERAAGCNPRPKARSR